MIKGASMVVAYTWPHLFWIYCLLAIMACGKDENNVKLQGYAENKNKNLTSVYPEAARLEFPRLKGGNSIVIVHHALLNKNSGIQGVNYSTEWDPTINAQRWSCYQMYGQKNGPNWQVVSRYYVRGGASLTPESQYPNDPDIASTYQFSQDPYWNSGYDHGHICPSADRQASDEANYQTFFITNMQPQVNSFNAGIWNEMEKKVRTWINQGGANDTLYVCKGGTIDKSDGKSENIITYIGSGRNRIPVPRYFFMALLYKNSQGYKALGFWIEHSAKIDKDTPLSNFVVNIRKLEDLTGIDFFCNLDDETEEHVETLSVESVKSAWGLK